MFAFGWASFANLMAALKGKLGKVLPSLDFWPSPPRTPFEHVVPCYAQTEAKPPEGLGWLRPYIVESETVFDSVARPFWQDVTHDLKASKEKNMDAVRWAPAARTATVEFSWKRTRGLKESRETHQGSGAVGGGAILRSSKLCSDSVSQRIEAVPLPLRHLE